MSIYNEDELNVPTWLDKDFFREVLSKHENDEDIEIVNLELSPASMKGDHYASIMYRTKVDYKFSHDGPIASTSLIVKTIPEEEGMKREMLEQMNLFETEINMYTQTLPKFEQILAEHGDNIKLAPKIIYHTLKPRKVIVLEDLCTSGYTTVRGRYLTEDEVRAVYRKLAKMHAVSYMLGHSEQHAEVTKYQDGMFSIPGAEEHPFVGTGIKKFIDMLSVHNELDEYLPKIKALEKDMFAQARALYTAYQSGAKDEIFVLNHGDFHMKNIMFKFNKKTQLEDFMLVDFQISTYAPSNMDLLYSTYMILSPELRKKSNELHHYYFSNFVETLKKIQYQGELPQFADFQISNIKYRHFSLFLLSTFLPMIMSMMTKSPDELKNSQFGDVIAGATDLFYRSPEYVAEVKRLLPIYLHAGYLD